MIAITATALLSAELGGAAVIAALGALAVFLGVLGQFLLDALTIDAFVAVGIISAVAFTLVALRCDECDHVGRWSLLIGACLGLAIGAKFTALPIGLVVGTWVLWKMRKRAGVRYSLTIIASAAALAAFWYTRNWALLGDPFYPATIAPFRHTIFTGGPAYSTLDASLGARIFARQFQWVYANIASASIVFGPSLVLIATSAFAFRKRYSLQSYVWLLLALAIVFAFTPFTGSGENNPNYIITIGSMRYILPAALLAIALTSKVMPPHLARLILAGAAIYNTAIIVLHPGEGNRISLASAPAIASVATAMALTLLYYGMHRWRSKRVLALLAITAVLATVSGTAVIVEANSAAPNPTLLQARALANSEKPMIVINTINTRVLLGSNLDLPLQNISAQDQDRPESYPSATQLNLDISRLAPIAVAVGDGIYPPPRVGALHRIGKNSVMSRVLQFISCHG